MRIATECFKKYNVLNYRTKKQQPKTKVFNTTSMVIVVIIIEAEIKLAFFGNFGLVRET